MIYKLLKHYNPGAPVLSPRDIGIPVATISGVLRIAGRKELGYVSSLFGCTVTHVLDPLSLTWTTNGTHSDVCVLSFVSKL